MKRCILLIAVQSFLLLGCPSSQNADVEHDNVCMDLSPDGNTLVFSAADGDLYLFDIANSVATRLIETKRIESSPSFSPDGRQVVFAATESSTAPSHLYVLQLDDHSITEVTADDERSDVLPRFTPDGKRIVFARAYRNRPYSLGGWTWDMWDVCSINADGTGMTRLTEEGYYQIYRVVPRTNEEFVYAADPMELEIPAVLYTVSAYHEPSQLIPEPGTSNANVNAWASDPMISPDGKTLTYCSDRSIPFLYDVCVETGEGESTGLVGTKSGYNRYPDFFPDGQRLVFLAGNKFNSGNRPIYSLWEVSLSGETKELATSDLFTNPTNWLTPKGSRQSAAPKPE
ncbi:MAG: PD40 domain-containing protein [Planctomycetaceae bacterium]|nr:PD40 domain-containing protein [Planctomycetaceae bacterium]